MDSHKTHKVKRLRWTLSHNECCSAPSPRSVQACELCEIVSVRLWTFKDGGSLKARFLQRGDQVSRISFDFLKWRSTGPQKLTKMSF